MRNGQKLMEPLTWRKPRRVFVNSMSDLFHERVADEWIDRIFGVMALARQHQFMVLTKRAERMRRFLAEVGGSARERVENAARFLGHSRGFRVLEAWPLPNVWLGVSVEDQRAAEARVPELLATPAALRFVSCEPLLGPVSLPSKALCPCSCYIGMPRNPHPSCDGQPTIDWVIVGGESGPRARPMKPEWVRQVRDQCLQAGVPFFFKQWGDVCPESQIPNEIYGKMFAGGGGSKYNADNCFHRIGKRNAGRLLDGVEWSQIPGRVERRVANGQ